MLGHKKGGQTDRLNAKNILFDPCLPPSVVTADERSCRDHAIPDHPKRYSAGITTINNYLFVCAGYTGGYGCKKLDLNAENPSWATFTDLPWRPYHYLLETVGDYMYAIGTVVHSHWSRSVQIMHSHWLNFTK